MVKKTGYEEKVQGKLDQCKEKLEELEKSIGEIKDKTKEGYEKALEELKAQRTKAQELFDKLKKGGEDTLEEGKKGIDNALEVLDKGYTDMKGKVGEIIEKTKEKTHEIKEEFSRLSLWEKVEKGFDEAWEASKNTAYMVSKGVERAAQRTKLKVENHRLKSQISRTFAEIGDEVYTKIIREGKRSFVPTKKVKALLDRVLELEKELDSNVELLTNEKEG